MSTLGCSSGFGSAVEPGPYNIGFLTFIFSCCPICWLKLLAPVAVVGGESSLINYPNFQEMAGWLPEGWEIVKETAKNGSQTEHYINKATGEVYKTKESMLRHANYVMNIKPHLDSDSEFKKCYMDTANYHHYADRPWEHGNLHKLHDYIMGIIGEERDLIVSGSSSSPITEAMPAQQPVDDSTEKVVEGSTSQASGSKLQKKTHP